jgi:RecJ-like exonuclease
MTTKPQKIEGGKKKPEERDVDKVPYHMRADEEHRNENIRNNNPLCDRCSGTGNQLLSMYQKCEKCNGTGIQPKQKIEGGTTTPIQETWKEELKEQFGLCTGTFTEQDCLNIEDYITSLLQRKERETIKRVMEVRPNFYPASNMEECNYHNKALQDWTDNINKLK